jgi:hypothetical protein
MNPNKPIEFVVGNYYRTRGGEKVKLVHVFGAENRFPLLFVDDVGSSYTDARGSYNHSGPGSDKDIVAEWRDPVHVAGWVNLFEQIPPIFYLDKKQADYCGYGRIACVYVSGIEEV